MQLSAWLLINLSTQVLTVGKPDSTNYTERERERE